MKKFQSPDITGIYELLINFFGCVLIFSQILLFTILSAKYPIAVSLDFPAIGW